MTALRSLLSTRVESCRDQFLSDPQSLLNTSKWRHWSGNSSGAETSNASKPLLWAMNAAYYSSLQWVVERIDRDTHRAQGLEDMSLGLGGFQMGQAT